MNITVPGDVKVGEDAVIIVNVLKTLQVMLLLVLVKMFIML